MKGVKWPAPDGQKYCPVCQRALPLDSFYATKRSPGRFWSCKDCTRAKNRQRTQEIRRRWHVKEKFGITIEMYNTMLEGQNNRCAICGVISHDISRNLSVDHNHNTGIVRGLLCLRCNSLLGYAQDNPYILIKAIMYLENNK